MVGNTVVEIKQFMWCKKPNVRCPSNKNEHYDIMQPAQTRRNLRIHTADQVCYVRL